MTGCFRVFLVVTIPQVTSLDDGMLNSPGVITLRSLSHGSLWWKPWSILIKQPNRLAKKICVNYEFPSDQFAGGN